MSCSPETSGSPGEARRFRLSKRDIETLMDAYDDDPVAALDTALAAIGAPETLRASLRVMTTPERDALAKDLIEWRGLEPPEAPGVNH